MVVSNGVSNPSSNPELGCLQFSYNTREKGMNLSSALFNHSWVN